MKRVRANVFDIIYEQSIRTSIPASRFSLELLDEPVSLQVKSHMQTQHPLKALETSLQVSLNGSAQVLVSEFSRFVNSAAFDKLMGRRLHLVSYLTKLSETCDKLTDLIENPWVISEDYALVYRQLKTNWEKARPTVDRTELKQLVDILQRLRSDALRIANDHPAEERSRGRLRHDAFRTFMQSLWNVANAHGADMTLPRHEADLDVSGYPLKDFALLALDFAISMGKIGIDQLEISEEVKQTAHTNLVHQWNLRGQLVRHLRSPEGPSKDSNREAPI